MIDYRLEQRTIGQVLADKAERVPDLPYLLWEDESFTYADVERLSNALARGLAQRGIGRGSHVALFMDNCPEYLWASFALGKLGAVGVPINTAAKGQLLQYLLSNSDCTDAIVDAGYAATVRAAVPQLRVIEREALAAISGEHMDGAETPPDAAVSFKDPWFIMYTSGTTGPSKGVVCPHAHPLTVGYRVARAFELGPEDRLYTCLPMFHGNALWYSALTAVWSESSIALVPRFSASRFWSDIHRYGATEFNAIMSVATILEKLPPTPEEQDNPLRLAFVVPLPLRRQELEERWDLKFTCNYSMTELVPPAVLRAGEGLDRPNVSGRRVEHVEMRIVDEDDREVPPDTPGEIVVRPKEPWTMFTGYYNNPDATATAFRNLWFHTGDRGKVDADGFFTFVDRTKDAIRRRGENISAHEIEIILESCDAIAEAAAVPVPSDLGEDEVAVYVVVAAHEKGLSELDVVRFAEENLPYYMVPRYVALVDELPKTASHKKEKHSLRERALRERGEFWDRVDQGIQIRRPDGTAAR
ncbi:AMP-binding protein [Capillimicrobium parvum]|uniref:Crotonobetaine/carnitine--CoA ligase n=1 Tax=Capillimicrobium parvum TaxID=2884022 RepID=A0A9E6XWS8_9ACTN|nr:AMP-binding protein [Capillimicrobium parvum]UGS35575.1 Crotonobetaine/carnitine--CoA ligase [Capillimicrobium parvum]